MATLREKTIGDIESEIGSALARLASTNLPPGLEGLKYLIPMRGTAVRVALHRNDRERQDIRSNARASNWTARNGYAVVSFEMLEESSVDEVTPDPISDLVRILDSAERDSRFREFVGLKPFRDQYLLAHGAAWTQDAHMVRETLRAAIDDHRLVLRSSIPNPKNPEYPTTTICLNREHPEVKRILAAAADQRSPFRPVVISGPPLSSSIMAERR
jgi:hypothetical protein